MQSTVRWKFFAQESCSASNFGPRIYYIGSIGYVFVCMQYTSLLFFFFCFGVCSQRSVLRLCIVYTKRPNKSPRVYIKDSWARSRVYMDSKMGGPKSFLPIHKSKVVSTNRLLRPARTLKLAHIKLPLLLFAWKVQMFLKLRAALELKVVSSDTF
jgi:hypothetical protein